MNILADNLKLDMEANHGKISYGFIKNLAEFGEVKYLHPTPNMRLCIITIYSGHEVLGMAQVLDAKNDIEKIGNEVAYDRAVDELWSVCGSVAKVL